MKEKEESVHAPKITREQAEKEITGWLNYKKVSAEARDQYQEIIDTLIGRIQDGTLTVDPNEKYKITHHLLTPVENEDGIVAMDRLTYKARIQVRDTVPYLRGVKANDSEGRVTAYLSAITGVSKGMLQTLDTVDYSIAQNIVVFFIG